MTDVVEQEIGGLTVRIDRLLCVGFGDCVEVAPELFELDGEDIVRFREPLPEIDRKRLITSCDICPVDALSIHDADGEQLVP